MRTTGTYINESWHTYEGVMTHMWRESWHTYEGVTSHIFMGNPVFKRPLSPTISFLPCRIEGPLFDTGVVLRCAICTARGWHQVAQHMHNPNGIIGARSASPACNWCGGGYLQRMPLQLRFFGITLQSKVHNAVQCFCIGPHFVPKRDRNKVFCKDCFAYEYELIYMTHPHVWPDFLLRRGTHMKVSRHTYECVTWLIHMYDLTSNMNDLGYIYEWDMAHIWRSHVIHMKKSGHTCGWVMSHISNSAEAY